MSTNFTYPPLGSFAAVSSDGAVNIFDTLTFSWIVTWEEVRVFFECLMTICGGPSNFESCDFVELIKDGPRRSTDEYTIDSLQTPLDEAGLSTYSTYPVKCRIFAKPWDADNDSLEADSPVIIGAWFTVTSNSETSTTYQPSTTSTFSSSAMTTTAMSNFIQQDTASSSTTSDRASFNTLPSTINPMTSSSSSTILSLSLTIQSLSSTSFSISSPFAATSTKYSPSSTQPAIPISSSAGSPGLSKPLVIGLSIGLPLGALCLTALFLLVFSQRRKRRHPRRAPAIADNDNSAFKPELPAYTEKPQENVDVAVGQLAMSEVRHRHDCIAGTELDSVSQVELESPKGGDVSKQFYIDIGHVHEMQ